MTKRITITYPDNRPPHSYTDDSGNAFEPDEKLLEPGAIVTVYVGDYSETQREVIHLQIPGAPPQPPPARDALLDKLGDQIASMDDTVLAGLVTVLSTECPECLGRGWHHPKCSRGPIRSNITPQRPDYVLEEWPELDFCLDCRTFHTPPPCDPEGT